jgi:O-antigen/teichoic acid export membrane protein
VKTEQSTKNLTSGRVLARSTGWNLLGQLLPTAVGVLAIPVLVRGLGVDRFGIFSLAFIVIGYFSLFDLGMGRALTKLVADRLGLRDHESIPMLVWTSLLLMFLLGIFGGLLTLGISPWLVHKALKVPVVLQPETLNSFYLMSLSIPLVTVTSGLRGILEAQQRFRVLSLIRVPITIFSFIGPILVLPFSRGLVAVMGVLIAVRILGFIAHWIACMQAMPELRRNLRIQRSAVVPVLRLGGWMTISNVVSPFLVYFDRFLIGGLVSATAISYYTAPMDMVTRLAMIPAAIAAVLFPAFAMTIVHEPERTIFLLKRGLKYTMLAVFPVICVIVVLAPEILRLWLGAAFAHNGTSVLRWLAVGVLMNCLAQMPFVLVQGAGRPDLVAKLHLVELPIYGIALWILTQRFGIEGAALAWAGRATIDAACLFLFTHRLFPHKSWFLSKLATAVAVALSFLGAATLPEAFATKMLFLALLLSGLTCCGWFWVLAPEERSFLLPARGNAR